MASPRETVIHRSQSDDGVIEITQQGDIRALYFGSSAKQSALDILRPEQLQLSYTRAMVSALLFFPAPRSVLLIGLGAGSLANFLWHHFPSCQIDVAEMRADVVHLAHSHFALPIDPRLRIHIGDGGQFMALKREQRQTYDLILIDAYNHDGIADEVRVVSFFENVHACLNQHGTLSMNLWTGEPHYPLTLQYLEQVFPRKVLQLPVDERANVIVLASRQKIFPGAAKPLKKRALALEDRFNIPFLSYMRQLKRCDRWLSLSRLFQP